MDQSKNISELLNNPVTYVILAWVLREAWRSIAHNRKASHEAIDGLKREFMDALHENSKELSKLSLAMMRLETIIAALDKSVDMLPKIKADVDVLHERMRQMNGAASS